MFAKSYIEQKRQRFFGLRGREKGGTQMRPPGVLYAVLQGKRTVVPLSYLRVSSLTPIQELDPDKSDKEDSLPLVWVWNVQFPMPLLCEERHLSL